MGFAMPEYEIPYEKSADQMFEELGYKKRENETWIVYISETKDIDFYIYGKTIEIENGHESKPISIQELKAINKKCLELRMDRGVINNEI